MIVFILLAGYMPFSGAEALQIKKISAGEYNMKPEVWKNISETATDFTKALLQVDPSIRLTASAALDHPFISARLQREIPDVGVDVVEALRQFGKASKFKQACMQMMAWSLSNEDRDKVRGYFIAMDASREGTITLTELKSILVDKFQVPNDETLAIFNALDTNSDEEIHYSDFLAAMLTTRISLHDSLLLKAFKRFDVDSSGYITVENLRDVLGETFEGFSVERLLAEADQLKDGRISYHEFVSYLRGDSLEDLGVATSSIIDCQMMGGRKLSFGAPVLASQSKEEKPCCCLQ